LTSTGYEPFDEGDQVTSLFKAALNSLPRKLSPYPVNRRPILSTAALSCQPPPYPANRRPIQPTAALSYQLPPYLVNRRPILPTAALSSQLPPYPANRRPILPTSALSSQLPPYPPNCRPGICPGVPQATTTTLQKCEAVPRRARI